MNALRYNSQQGFVILFAIIISAMIVLIGAGVFTVAFKETVLSSTANESQIALFAADTGMECTLYHEFVEAGTGPTLDCGGRSNTKITTGTGNYEFNFVMIDTSSCGTVTVDHAVLRGTVLGTELVSRGYNVCIDEIPDFSSQFLVERRLEAWYPNAVATPPPSGGGSGGGTGVGSSGGAGASSI